MSASTDHYGPWHHVRVGCPGRDETVRGHDRDEAIANAEHTWPFAAIEYVGVDDAFVNDEQDAEPPDWWGTDHHSGDEVADEDEAVHEYTR